MRAHIAVVISCLWAVACGGQSVVTQGSTDAGAPSFPTGTYARCAEGLYDKMLNVGGFEDGATLAVAQDGDALKVTYADMNGATSTLGFTATSEASATLADVATLTGGFGVQCVEGLGSTGTYPATLDASAGALTYQAGTLFLTLTGTIHGDAGPCGPQSAPATFWIVAGDGPQIATAGSATAPGTSGLAGTYACISQVETAYESGGTKQFVAGGGEGGTLTLTGDGAALTAAYTGDTSLAGTLHFDSMMLHGGPGLTTPCEVPLAVDTPPPVTTGTLDLAAASITRVGSTLFLAFDGSMAAASACAGARKAGSLVCTAE